MKKKVLHVINSLTIGGAEALLVNSLAEGGLPEHTESMLVYFHGESSLLDKVDKSVKVVNLNYKGWLTIGTLMNKMRGIILSFKPDIIHTHLNPCDFYVNFIRPKKIPQVHTLHIAYSTDKETRPIFKFLEKNFFFKTSGCNLIFLSEFTKKDFLANVNFKGNSFVLHNSIDDKFFDHDRKLYVSSTNKSLKIVAVGSIREQKNYPYLLEIFKFLKGYNIQLDIFGGGDSSKFKKIINESDLSITMKGEISDINEVIDRYDLFIMSSTNEGFPLSVFEAMAANIPVMISNIPPLKSIVNEHAIYFDLDDAKYVSNQILDIYNFKVDLNGLAAGARQYAEITVRRETYLEKLLSIYDVILDRQKDAVV